MKKKGNKYVQSIVFDLQTVGETDFNGLSHTIGATIIGNYMSKSMLTSILYQK